MNRDDYKVVIGIEVHAQLCTQSKVWCSCEVGGSDYENSRVCEVCSAHPGTLPVLNQGVFDYAIKAGLALDCKISPEISFDRKNYFYPDLPKGYQITQFYRPIAQSGVLKIRDDKENEKTVRIRQIQIEEDTGKSIHVQDYSLINLNRAGTPLIEIVSEPDLSSAAEALDYLKKLHGILVYTGVTQGNMQDGNFRCDVNLSLQRKDQEKMGIRSEVKNLNSFRHVEKAIHYETQRHWNLIKEGKEVPQETRLFDIETLSTKVLRVKSDADDYRYFNEPDLLPVFITEQKINSIRADLPELPQTKITRLMKEYGLSEYAAETLSSQSSLADYFEQTVKMTSLPAVKVGNWVMVELMRLINEYNAQIDSIALRPKHLAELLNLIAGNKISGTVAKDVLTQMYDTQKSAHQIVTEQNLALETDTDLVDEVAERLILKHPEEVEQYRAGRERILGFLVGQAMKELKGKADPALISQTLKDKIGQ